MSCIGRRGMIIRLSLVLEYQAMEYLLMKDFRIRFMCRENLFETGLKNRFSGCEDPRIVKIDDKFYMTYTAYDGVNPARIALTSIEVSDFVERKWNWNKPVLISPPGRDDKNSCIVPEKINGRYPVFHRFDPSIWIDFVDDLEFSQNKFLQGEILMEPRLNMWDSIKIGIGPPPIKTEDGWILIYHGISKYDKKYRLGACLLDFTREKKSLPVFRINPRARGGVRICRT